jgi:hypothetical protein
MSNLPPQLDDRMFDGARRADGTLDPEPVADGRLVAEWMNTVARGALVEAAVLGCSLALLVVMAWSSEMPWDMPAWVSSLLTVAGAAAAWMLVSGEPERPWWLAAMRWAVRAWAVASVVLAAVSLVSPGLSGELAGRLAGGGNPERLIALAGVTMLALVAVRFRYLRQLSWRLGDRTLRMSFGFLFWVCVVAAGWSALGVLMVTELPVTATAPATAQASAPATQPYLSAPAMRTGMLLFGLAAYAWPAWLMWRLSRRTRAAADYHGAEHEPFDHQG